MRQSKERIASYHVQSFHTWEYEADFTDRVRTLQPETCLWIEKNVNINRWLYNPEQPIFWLEGNFGLGKSCLMTHLVRTWRGKFELQNYATKKIVVHSFCNKQDNHTTSSILCTLIHQIIDLIPDGGHIANELMDVKINDPPPSAWPIDRLWTLLEDLIANSPFKKVFMFIDGLDECDSHTQADIIKRFRSCSPQVRGFVSSQPLESIRSTLLSQGPAYVHPWFQMFNADEQETNINADIDRYIEANIDSVGTFKNWTDEQREQVRQWLADKRNGSFLPIKLVFGTLYFSETSDLSATLEEAFENLDVRNLYTKWLQNAPQKHLKSPSRILKYVLYTFRSLTVAELTSACNSSSKSMSKSSSTPAASAQPPPEYTAMRKDLRMFEPILKVRQQDSTISFFHASARDFLIEVSEKKDELISPLTTSAQQAHVEIALLLLDILIAHSQHHFPSRYENNYLGQLQTVLGKHPLLDYALTYWDLHVREVVEDDGQNREKRTSMLQKLVVLVDICHDEDRETFASLISDRRGTQAFEQNMHQVSDLEFYAWIGSAHMVQRSYTQLLLQGLDEDEVYERTQSGLYSAASAGQMATFSMLISCAGPTMSLKDRRCGRLLRAAMTGQNPDIIRRVVLEREPGPRELAHALWPAILREDTQSLNALLENSCRIFVTDRNRMTVMHWIVTEHGGKEADAVLMALCALMDRGLSLAARDASGNTVLHYLCWEIDLCKDVVVLPLLERGGNLNVRNNFGWLPIHLASRRANAGLLEQLMDRSSELAVRQTTKGGLTMLHWAMQRDFSDRKVDTDYDVVRSLLVQGADLHAETRRGKTPIAYALEDIDAYQTFSGIFFRLDGAGHHALSDKMSDWVTWPDRPENRASSIVAYGSRIADAMQGVRLEGQSEGLLRLLELLGTVGGPDGADLVQAYAELLGQAPDAGALYEDAERDLEMEDVDKEADVQVEEVRDDAAAAS